MRKYRKKFRKGDKKETYIPKVMYQRNYEATEDLPMGQQAQVDFGEFKLLDTSGNSIKLWFIAFVLAHFRYKYVEWLDRPFTTREVIRTHENAFSYFGGKPKEMVYDQDHLILVHVQVWGRFLTCIRGSGATGGGSVLARSHTLHCNSLVAKAKTRNLRGISGRMPCHPWRIRH